MKKTKFKMSGIYLAYDHGMEHGPTDFNDRNISPAFVIDLAKKAEVDALVLLKGAARKYYNNHVGVPLILKLNQKTKLCGGEPLSTQTCSVKEAIALGAAAVGYTVYAGSRYEHVMLKEFGKIEEEAHKYGIPVIMWSYPRGRTINDDEAPDIIAYAARVAFEMGADIVKLKYPNNDSKLNWVVKAADTTKVFLSGGSIVDGSTLEARVSQVIGAGFSGVAVGRNIFQSDNPLERIKRLKEIIKST